MSPGTTVLPRRSMSCRPAGVLRGAVFPTAAKRPSRTVTVLTIVFRASIV